MSRTPANYPLQVVRGSTWEDYFDYQDPDGNPIDLTGYEARMQVRTLEGRYGVQDPDDTLIASYRTTDVDPQLFIETPAGGAVPSRVRLRVEAEDTIVLNPDNKRRLQLSYGLELYVPTLGMDPEYVIPLVEGRVTVRGEVVR